MTRKERLPPNVSSFLDRHGKRRYRWRKAGRSQYFTAHPNTPEGQLELAAFVAGLPSRAAPERHARGTVGWLARRYCASPGFAGGKAPARLHTARLILDKFVAEFANDQVSGFRFDHVEAILMKAARPRIEPSPRGPRKRGGPSAAANLRGELLPLFDYAIRLGLTPSNPVRLATAPSVPRGGFHAWSEAEIAQYRATHPLGTKARLALEIFLWTWMRRGDASGFGRSHLRAGRITYTQAKTGKTLHIPAAPQLLAAIEAMPATGIETFLVTASGKPFSKAGLGNKMREWCDQASLPHCTAHGLRKAGARRAAEAGGSNQQLKAMGGWSGDSEVSTYTASADQARLAESTIAAVIKADLSNPEAP